MSGNNIKIGVEVSDNGSSNKTSNNVNNLKDVLDHTATSATKATKAISAMGAAQPVNRPAGSTIKRIKQVTGGGEDEEERGMYAAQRGTVGTGAAGRDFAKQSQGLDGLVRLYATFAANIYAAGAAFTALSQAMDTTNMVQGLNQLGAATGQNLGGLSKTFVQLTDGAISFKDAMSATVKVTSAGFGTDTVTRLAVVAKKASQSLGVDMVDAVSRLSRGITKIEPELLDELGLFTKIDKAQEDYARSLGRTVTSLSDFEKRQAFANAVLAEGEKKFNSIDIDANPYAKLLATLKNVAQTGLEFVNKFLGPVVKLLAESPTGVALAIAGIAAVLTKQALPAINNFREGLVQANEQALAKVKQLQETIQANKSITMQQAANVAVDAEVKKLEKSIKGFNTAASNLSKKAEDAAFAGDIEGANKANAQAQRKLELAELNKTKIIETRKQAELLDAQQTAANSKNIFAQENILQRQKTSMEQNARLSKSLLNVADDAATLGAGFGFKRLGLELKNASKESDITGAALGRLQTATLAIRGTFGILTTAVSGILAAFGPWIAVLTMVLPLLSMLYDWLRGDSKQAEETAKSFDALQGSIENTARTIERINKLEFGEQLTVETIIARSNALNDLSVSFTKVLDSITKQKAAQSGFAKFIDDITGGLQKEAAEKLSKSLILALEAAQEGEAKEKAKDTLKALLGIDVLKEADIKSAIAKTKEFDAVTTQAARAVNTLAKEEDKRAKGLAGAKEAQDKTTKSYDDFIQSVLKTDAATTFAKNMISFGLELDKAFQDPISSVAELNRIASDSKTLAMFSPEAQKDILKYNMQLQTIEKQLEASTAAERKNNEEIDKQRKLMTERRAATISTLSSSRAQPLITGKSPEQLKVVREAQAKPEFGVAPDSELKKLLDFQKTQQQTTNKLKTDLKETAELANKVIQAPAKVFDKGMDLFITELNKSYGKAGLLLAEAVASAYGDIPGASLLSAELKNKEIANQISLIDATISLTKATTESALRMQEANIIEKIKMASGDGEAGRGLRNSLQEELKQVENTLKAVTKATGSAGELANLRAEMKAATTEAQRSLIAEQIRVSQTAAAGQGQKSVLKAQADVNVFQAELKYETDKAAAKTKSNDLIKQENTFAIQRLNLQKDSLGLLREDDILKAASLTKENLSLTYSNKNITIAAEQANLNKTIEESEKRLAEFNKTAAGAKSREAVLQRLTIEGAKEKLVLLEGDKKLTKEIFEFEKEQADLKAKQQILQNIEKIRLDEVSTQNTLLGFVKQEQEARLVLKEQELSLLTARGTASETYLIKVNAEIAAKRQELQVAQELKAVEDSRAAALANLLMLRAAIPVVSVQDTEMGTVVQQDPALLAESQTREQTILNTYEKQKASILGINALKTQGNELSKLAQLETAANNKRLEEQAIAMERIQGIAKDLGTVFGEFGKSLGAGLESILKVTQDYDTKRRDADKKYSKDRLVLEKSQTEEIANIYAEGLDPEVLSEQVTSAKQQQTKDSLKLDKDYATKSKNLEMDKNIAIVSSAKSMFKEKTAAYKVLSAVEKAMTVAKLAMNAQQMISDGILTAKSIANSLERAFVDGKAAVVKAYASIPFPFNIAAAATVAALVAAVIGKSVSKGGGGGFTATSEQKKEVAGTGQMYDESGKLVSRSGGVPTDDKARAESVEKSLRYMEEHMSEDTKLSNKMLQALKGIKDNTEGFSAAVLSTFRAPNAGNFDQFGRTGTLKEGYGQRGGTSALVGGAIGGAAAVGLAAAGTGAALMGFASAATLLGPVGLLVGVLASQIPVVGKAISSIFGGKTTRDITDFGIAVKGTVKEIALGADETIQQFADVQSKRKGGWFRKDKITNETILEEANNAVKGYVSGIFTSAQTALKEAGKVLGRDTAITSSIIDATEVVFKLSAKGISGEELAKAIEGEISIAVNNAAAAAFPELEKFAKPFEEAGQTILRLATNMVVLKDSLSNLGIVLPTLAESVTSTVTPEMQADLNKLLTAKTAAQAELDRVKAGVGQTITETISTGEGSIGGYGGYTQEITRTISTAEDATVAQTALTKAISDYDTQAAAVAQAQDTRTANNIAYQQKFVDLNDDIDTLNKRLTTYASTILTTGQRTVAAQTKYIAIVDELDESTSGALKTALTNVKNKAEFDDLFTASLASGTDAGLAMATALLKITPLYVANTEALEKYNTALEDQKIKMGALGIAGGLTPDQAKSLERDRQRIKISEEYTTVQAAELIANQNAIWQAEDRLDITKREIALLSEQGYTYSALLENRKLELSLMTEEQKILQTRLYAIQDQNKTDALNVRLMEASGDATGALYARRVLELRSMSELDQEILRRIWLLEDEKKTTSDTTNLAIELMEAEGDTIGALNARRTQELKGLSLVAQEMKIRIWTLQDEKKVLTAKNAQEIKIYEALGNASEALRLQREAELESMDAALRPGQRYLYALQDQKTIYDKLKSSISNVTSSLKASIQTLKDYQFSLKTGDKTILKPAEVYALKKQEFFNLKAIAEAVATTPAEEALQATAISKLPAAADAFLESSRTLFASGQAYTDDFNLIDSALTSLSGILTSQLSDAEKNLKELTTANGFLETIGESTKTTAELMAELVAANANVAITRAAASAAGYTSAGGSASDFNTGTSGGIPGVQPVTSTETGSAIPGIQQTLTLDKQKVLFWYQDHQDITDRNPRDDIDPATGINALDYWAQNIARYGLGPTKLEFAKAVARDYGKSVLDVNDFGLVNEYARGGLASGLSIVGEEGPELVDFQTPGRVYPAGQTTAMLANNTALVNEIKALRQEVEKLRNEQKEQTGHLITTNYDANRIAAEMLAKVTEESSKEAAWANRSAAKVV